MGNKKLGLRGFAILASATSLVAFATAPSARAQGAAEAPPQSNEVSAFWRNATIYFLLTDRFANGDKSNDPRPISGQAPGKLRGFEGGDLKGITRKIDSGYFNALGVDAIWTTPVIENVRGSVVEGEWGRTYAYHGYWPRDWTAIDPRLGSEKDFGDFVAAAHRRGIRVIFDVIINHAGPVTDQGDPRWPSDWVRGSIPCTHKSFASATSCELSFTLQDVLTENETNVSLPPFLIDKWRAEGRLEQEQKELDAFFARTGYPRAPKYYIVKWLTDWVRDYGIDGFRVDTAKHVEPEIWGVLKREADIALADWRRRHSKRLTPDMPFYMVGEVFNYGVSDFAQARGRDYDYGDRKVDFYANGFDALINMDFPTHAAAPVDDQFQSYAKQLEEGAFKGRGILSYLASHDDMGPLDPERKTILSDAARLMLSPGAVQIYYGDEVGRSLVIPGTVGDATLRSSMDWRMTQTNKAVLKHWRRLGTFRHAHPALGAGKHEQLSISPYTFARTLAEEGRTDRVVVSLRNSTGPLSVVTGAVFPDGLIVKDAYSGEVSVVRNGQVDLRRAKDIILLEARD